MDSVIIFIAQYFIVVVLLIAALYVLYIFKSNRKTFIRLSKLSIIALPLSYLTAKVFERFIYDPRPFVVDHRIKPLIHHAADNGFPSDHTLLTMTMAAIIFAYNRKLGILLAVFSIAIGSARVAAGVHHPLDIIGAIVIAIGATLVSYLVLRKVIKY